MRRVSIGSACDSFYVSACGEHFDRYADGLRHESECRACEAAAEDAYLKRKYGGAEGPDELTVDEHGLPYE